ncbi:hypothetical protein QJS04_geneDACA011004 [Acorus gramineus]|uniref:Trichome birefringence-like C-terminal domain-containing protein n=1 Tax=Acorus gramineus TaxID=55184 RepID=A0AAV9BEL6_ACOGR|nr:hypothetical protein QJS04_geneDACA011004 [Acorus gramineus]
MGVLEEGEEGRHLGSLTDQMALAAAEVREGRVSTMTTMKLWLESRKQVATSTRGVGFLITRTHSMSPLVVPTSTQNSTVKNMAGLISSTFSTGGNQPPVTSPVSVMRLKRFDGKDFLMRMKGKKMLFVGDSLSLNNWQSLLCLLHAAVPDAKTTFAQNTLYFKDYDVSVAFIKNWFLVDMVNNKDGVALVLDSIQGGKEWLGMDVLIFNSWHWWTHTGKGQP